MLQPKPCKLTNAMIFNTLRILKGVNKGDQYLEAYMGHYRRHLDNFFDVYHLAWWYGSAFKPKKILEIGVRTGISICQLLSAIYPLNKVDKVVLFDIFNDGYCTPELVKMNLNHLNIPIDNVEFIIGNSLETVPQYKKKFPEEKFDWILVDGDHTHDTARKDLENVVDMVNKGGIIVMDDLSDAPGECALKVVWEEFKAKHENEFEWFSNFDGKGVGFCKRL